MINKMTIVVGPLLSLAREQVGKLEKELNLGARMLSFAVTILMLLALLYNCFIGTRARPNTGRPTLCCTQDQVSLHHTGEFCFHLFCYL